MIFTDFGIYSHEYHLFKINYLPFLSLHGKVGNAFVRMFVQNEQTHVRKQMT